MDKEKLVTLLEDKLKEVDGIYDKYDLDRITQWKNEVLMILDNLLAEDSKYYKQISDLDFKPSVVVASDDDYDNSEVYLESFQRDINSGKSTINAIIFGVKNGLLS